MFKNHLKIAWRDLLKNKGYSIINIGGLALGMVVVILIGLWAIDEFSFNKYHKNYDRIAQIYERAIDTDNGDFEEGNSMMYITGTVLKENYSQHFKHILRANWIGNYSLASNGKVYTKTGEFIEDGALKMFSLKMIKGSHASLNDLNAIVLSASAAAAIYGNEDPIGKAIRINNKMEAVVKGVYEDLPKNTRFNNIKFFANWELYEAAEHEYLDRVRTIWDDYSFNLYVELKPESDFKTVDAVLNRFYDDHAPKDSPIVEKHQSKLFMYPMSKWHLYSDFKQGYATGGRITFVWLFIGIGIFVLFLACINFMNLSTARSEKRAKEIGVKKAVGCSRSQLINQFLSESFLVSFVALVLAFTMVLITLPWFNELAGKNMVIPWANPFFWGALLLFTAITGLLAGSYPALYLSSFNPISALKGSFKIGRYAAVPRKVLVVFQFIISIMLAIGTVIIFKQIEHTKDRPTGYDRNNLIMVEMNNPDYDDKYNLLRDELKNTGFVEEITQSSSPLTGVYNNGSGFSWPGKDPDKVDNFAVFNVTHDYGNTVGWEFVEGRDFSREFASDTLAIVINETAAEYMNLENPVGTFLSRRNAPVKIIGVTKDMVMQSPYEPVKQALFFLNYEYTNFINIKLKSGVPANSSIAKIDAVFSKVVPSANFDYKFVDREYSRKFISEERLGSIARVFTLLAILISCLGLFGLASFVAEQRTKEIGIRKVLGASMYNSWKLLSKDFVILIIISCVIAVPVTYHFMSKWLQNYEYRMVISWWIFGLVITGALVITLLTVSFQAIRAANNDPIKSLRTE